MAAVALQVPDRTRSARPAGRTPGSTGPTRCPASPSSAISTAGRWWRSAIREATIPITPGCQPSPASTYAGARARARPPAPRRRTGSASPTSRRSAFTASSSAAIARARAGVLGQQQLEPGVGAVQPPGGVDPRREPEADRVGVDARSGRRARPPSAPAGPACAVRGERRAGPRAPGAGSRRRSGTTSATVASATRSRSSSAQRGILARALEQRLRQLVRRRRPRTGPAHG